MTSEWSDVDILEPEQVTADFLVAVLVEWIGKIGAAIAAGAGGDECEGTRVVLGIGSILHAYFPGCWEKQWAREAMSLFEAARDDVSRSLREARSADQERDCQQYLANITARQKDLTELIDAWCPGWADEE